MFKCKRSTSTHYVQISQYRTLKDVSLAYTAASCASVFLIDLNGVKVLLVSSIVSLSTLYWDKSNPGHVYVELVLRAFTETKIIKWNKEVNDRVQPGRTMRLVCAEVVFTFNDAQNLKCHFIKRLQLL